MEALKKYNWINDDIKVKPISEIMANEFKEAEEADLAGDEGSYYAIVYNLDFMCERANAKGRMSKALWAKVLERYPFP